MFLDNELTELEHLIGSTDIIATEVSAKGVYWHIDHSLKAIISVSNAVKKSDPSAYRWKFNMIRSTIFLVGKIPRGKGKAPKVVLPPPKIIKEDLFKQMLEAKNGFIELESLPANSNFKHPYFGILNLNMTKRFLSLHTNHHLKIIRDIILYKNN